MVSEKPDFLITSNLVKFLIYIQNFHYQNKMFISNKNQLLSFLLSKNDKPSLARWLIAGNPSYFGRWRSGRSLFKARSGKTSRDHISINKTGCGGI
jgi:hypothetical protein